MIMLTYPPTCIFIHIIVYKRKGKKSCLSRDSKYNGKRFWINFRNRNPVSHSQALTSFCLHSANSLCLYPPSLCVVITY